MRRPSRHALRAPVAAGLALAAALAWEPAGPAWAAARASVATTSTVNAAPGSAGSTAGEARPTGEDRGAAWAAESERALASPLDAPLPYRELLQVSAGRAEAIAYRLAVRRGERITIDAEAPAGAELSLELYETSTNGPRRLDGVADTARTLAYEVRSDLPLLLLVRPGPAVDGEVTLTIRGGASLLFPVAGRGNRGIGSMFGVPRAGGKRTHHGVDIFAPRGTLVVAGADGEAWVGTNNLGGNIIFVADAERDMWLYYAHLDEQLVVNGARVERGDPIGRVGNTGNAKTTAPHLHFGIYSRGPIDPYPFIHEPTASPPRATARQRAQLGARMRVSAGRARLLGGPMARAGRLRELPRDTYFEVRGVHREFLRVRLPDGATGWLPARAGLALSRPIRRIKLSEETAVRRDAGPSAPVIGRAPGGEKVAVLGAFGPALYVRTASGLEGWI